MPITLTNVGNLASTGSHTIVLSIPNNLIGPTYPFSDNGWTCGAQISSNVSCTKTTNIAAGMGTDTVRIPVTPTVAASGSNVTFNVSLTNLSDSNTTNNTAYATNAVVG